MTPSDHPSDSAVQREAEAAIVAAAADVVGVSLVRDRDVTTILLGNGTRVTVDAASPDRSVIVEAYARQGRLKGAQLKKVAQDILKLALLEDDFAPGGVDRVIVFASAEAEQSVKGWVREAARRFRVRFLVVDIPQDLRDSIIRAQTRQIMVNVGEVADDVTMSDHTEE